MNVRRALSTSLLAFLPLIVASAPLSAAEKAGERELHAIGIYEGVEKTGNEIHGGRAVVTVNRPGKLVTLVLTSYEPVTWEVKLARDTKLEQIILGGSQLQAVKGTFTAALRGGISHALPYGDYKIDSERFRPFVEQLAKLSELPLASFHGAYSYRHESPFVVDQVQDDPRLAANYPQPVAEGDLPDLTFQAVRYPAATNRIPRAAGSYGSFTLAGPDVDSFKPLPAGIQRLAYDPAAKKYYGISTHDIFEVDLENGTSSKMEMGLDVPRLSWPTDLTFDTKRNRMLLVGLHGRGYLYAYEPATRTWSALTERLGIAAMAYHPQHDVLYAITLEHGEGGQHAMLSQFNAQGALLKSTKLGEPITPGSVSWRPGGANPQLIAVGQHLVLMTSPNQYGGDAGRSLSSYIYLIDPATSKVSVTWKQAAE